MIHCCQLEEMLAETAYSLFGNFNGQAGQKVARGEEAHVGVRFGDRNKESERVLGLAETSCLVALP